MAQFKYLHLIWLSLVVEVVILSLFSAYISDYELFSWVAVFFHSFLVLLILHSTQLPFKRILLWAFLLRVIFMIWDVYARNIFTFPNSGADSEMYFGASVRISENINLLNQPIRAGVFAKIMGSLFYLIGPQRLFAQYLNVIVGLFVVIVVYKMMVLLNITSSVRVIILAITAFFPNSLIMSSIFLREIIPTFFVALSLYYILLWYENKIIINIVLSLIMLGFAAVFHSGVIGIFVGYAFIFLFYKHQSKKFQFSSQTIISFLLVGSLAFWISTQFGNALFGKFDNVQEMEDVLETANTRLGNSAYLTGLEINSLLQLMIYGPIKMFYFLTSPLPMNWRGGMDIFSFLFDSSLYFITIWVIWRNWKYYDDQKPLIIGLIITLIGVAFIFGIGVGNAGTAIRHRQKIIPIILMLLAITLDEHAKYKSSTYIEHT